MNREEFWWQWITGPSRMVDVILEAIAQGKSVAVSGDIAWPESLRETVRRRLCDTDGHALFYSLDASFLQPKGVVTAVLDCVPHGQEPYYPSMDIVAYLARTLFRERTVLWIYCVKSEMEAEVRALCASLAAGRLPLSIVFECCASFKSARNTQYIEASKRITRLDVLQFVMGIVSDCCGDIDCGEYLCALVSELTGLRVESAASLCAQSNMLLRNPEIICRSLLPEMPGEVVVGALWKAQIRTVYPAIEERRLNLIRNNRRNIQEHLPYLDDWGHEITVSTDLELRHLIYFMDTRRLELSDKDANELRLLYAIRNDLAHLKPTSGTRIMEFFHRESI